MQSLKELLLVHLAVRRMGVVVCGNLMTGFGDSADNVRVLLRNVSQNEKRGRAVCLLQDFE